MSTPITIIGAGPAGMTAALFAARAGAKVRLIEGNAAVGRKLLTTGSGRANLTNQNVSSNRYTCADSAWMESVLSRFGYKELNDFFNSIGILTFATADGWCYPYSESAQSVVEAFENALDQAGIEVLIEQRVTAMRNKKTGFLLDIMGRGTLFAEHLIVAAGGKAFSSLGSRGELFQSLQEMGHTVNPLLPALAPVTADMKAWQRLQGTRLDARVSLFENDILLAETTGNLIFTAWGMNGPAVMDLSHLISTRPGAKLELRLNPLFATEAAFRALLQRERKTPTPLRVLLGSVLPPKLPPVLLFLAGLSEGAILKDVTEDQLESLMKLVTAIPFNVTGVRGFEYCQISTGGVPVNEVDPLTMQSILIPRLSLIGETLDVVGPCGGYNLHFAFASGALAGINFEK